MKYSIPKWEQEIMAFKGIKSTFIIEGNINDFYPVYDSTDFSSPPKAFVDLNMTLFKLFNENDTQTGYDFLFCDPATGIYNKFGDKFGNIEEMLQLYTPEEQENAFSFCSDRIFKKACKLDDIEKLSLILKNALADADRDRPLVAVMNFVSRYISSPTNLAPEENKMFLNLLFASLNASKITGCFNTLVMIVEKFNDLPAWFYYNNPNVRTISIPNPDKKLRTVFISKEYTEFRTNPELAVLQDKFTDMTEGLKHRELKELRNLYHRMLLKSPDTSLLDAVSVYKYGIVENMWHMIEKSRIQNLEEVLNQRVIGQKEAVSRTVTVIRRAVAGLSGLQHSTGQNKPRGVLFFAGPTGTGKTELAKALSEQLFGDENNCIRFDMSEFSESHSDQKLFGAPPGYIGYEAGGQLTNAVKQKPFSILLFDEIEKAHPSIMDKFLQILEDGRMTDGQGNTVYFSETLIIFTSNLGIVRQYTDSAGCSCREQLVSPDEEYSVIRPKILQAIKNHFKPEVLNRIGNNIIIYDFIRPDSAEAILRRQINLIHDKIKKQNKITVSCEESVIKYYFEKSREPEVLEMGGRGIGNLLETEYINPLADFIFQADCQEGDSIQAFMLNQKLEFLRK